MRNGIQVASQKLNIFVIYLFTERKMLYKSHMKKILLLICIAQCEDTNQAFTVIF
jgi:hypothetical protein